MPWKTFFIQTIFCIVTSVCLQVPEKYLKKREKKSKLFSFFVPFLGGGGVQSLGDMPPKKSSFFYLRPS